MVTIILIIVVLLAGFALGGLLGAPWVPAYKRDIERILNDCQLKTGQLYVELGCGDGRLCAAAARRGSRVIGYEVNPMMWLIASLRCIKYGSKAKIRLANFWRRPLGTADVVFTFLMPKFMPRLEDKLKKELKHASKFVSYIYALPTKKTSIKRKRWQVYNF